MSTSTGVSGRPARVIPPRGPPVGATRRSRSALLADAPDSLGTESFTNWRGEVRDREPLRSVAGGSATGSATGVAAGFDPRAVALSLRAALALPYHEADDAWLSAEAGVREATA